jgi:chromosome segregation ATPase
MQVERLTSAGMLLKQLCTTQGEELKALKEAFPALLKEMSELRNTHGKQERESDTAQRVVTLLQDEISSLRGKIECLTADLKQVFPPLTTFLSMSASSYLQNQHYTTPQICSSSVCSNCIWISSVNLISLRQNEIGEAIISRIGF